MSAPRADELRLEARLARRIGTFGGIYTTGLAYSRLVQMATLVLAARLLDPASYGVGVLLVLVATLSGVVITYLTLPGTMSWAFGGTADDLEVGGLEGTKGASNSGRAVCTGLVLAVVAAAVLVGATALVQGWLAGVVLDNTEHGDLVLLAALAGVPVALVRVLANTMRLGRRPLAFSMIEAVRVTSVLAAVAIFVGLERDPASVVVAYLVGTWAALPVALFIARHDVRPAVSLDDARQIIRRGAPILPVAIAGWVVMNADVFLLSREVSAAEVGTYGVAGNMARIAAVAVAVFMMAWGPLTVSPLASAVDQAQGRARATGRMFKYFVLAGCWLLVGLIAAGDGLVALSGEAYLSAWPLVPVIGAAFVIRGVFLLAYHGSDGKWRRRWLFALLGLAAAVFIGWSLLMIPVLGATGAALAGCAGFGTSAFVMLVVAFRQAEPMRVSVTESLVALALAACAAAGAAAANGALGPLASLPVDVLVIVMYPVGLVLTGVVPRHAVRPLLHAGRSVLPRPRSTSGLRPRLERLSPDELDLLDSVVRRRESVDGVAQVRGEEPDSVRLGLVVALRRLTDLPPGQRLSAGVADYVTDDRSVVAHTRLGRRLTDTGTDPLLIDTLYETALTVRAVSRRRWPLAGGSPPVART